MEFLKAIYMKWKWNMNHNKNWFDPLKELTSLICLNFVSDNVLNGPLTFSPGYQNYKPTSPWCRARLATALSNLPSPRNPKCAGIPTGFHGVPRLFLYPQVENAQEVLNDSKQMYSCAQSKINSREPSWMVWKYSSLQAVHIKLFFVQFLWPEVENERCHCHRYHMLN